MKWSELTAENEESNLTSFYVSFSDLMVLLGVFFVMLLSMSKIDIGSFEKIKTTFTGTTEGTLIELAEHLREIVEGVPGVPGVKVRMSSDGVRLDLDSAILFETGRATLKSQALKPLDPILAEIKKTSYSLDVEGHTDDVSLYRFYKHEDERVLETNWSLSGRRASSVIHYLLNYGISSRRVRLVGYASNRPLKPTKGIKGKKLEKIRSENRRVSLLVN